MTRNLSLRNFSDNKWPNEAMQRTPGPPRCVALVELCLALPRCRLFPSGAREARQRTTLFISVHSMFQGATLRRLALTMHANEII
jgi:hypothetical protein